MAKKSFEENMAQLEKIVEELEAGNLPLEKALKRFEEGMNLSRACFEKLDETEKKISLLLKQQNGAVQKTPFESEARNGLENDTEKE